MVQGLALQWGNKIIYKLGLLIKPSYAYICTHTQGEINISSLLHTGRKLQMKISLGSVKNVFSKSVKCQA